MALNVGELSAILSLDSSDFEKGLQKADKGTDQSKAKMAQLSKSAMVGFGGIAVAAGAFGLSAAKSASSLSETVSKTDNVFKSASGTIHDWAKGAADGFGQSRAQAEQAASSFGNLFVQLGTGADQAAGMSMQMTELASDFASFHDADISEVIGAQTAAFRGEYDALQRFVPTINAAAVEQKALEMTGKATTGELTVQEKALATHALMMSGAGDALGDFDRTQESAANQTRTLTANMDNQKAAIGERLLPIMTGLLTFLNDHLNPILITGAVLLGAMTLAFIVLGIQAMVSAISVAAGWTMMGARALLSAGQMAAAWLIALGPIGLVIAAIALVAFLVIKNWDTIKEGTRAAWDWVTEKISSVVEWLKGVPGSISKALSGAWDGLTSGFKAAINWIIGKWNAFSLKIPEFDSHIPGVGKVGGFSIDTPDIPLLATGGRVMGSGLALVGEKGPELLSLNRGASVIPLDRAGGGNTTIEVGGINIYGVRDADDLESRLPELQRALVAGVGRVG